MFITDFKLHLAEPIHFLLSQCGRWLIAHTAGKGFMKWLMPKSYPQNISAEIRISPPQL